MSEKGTKITPVAIALLIVGIIIGAVIGYFIAPKGVPIEEYNRLKSENEELKAKVEELQSQLEELGAPKEITIVVWAVGPDEPSVYRFENFKIAADILNKMLEDVGANIKIKIDGFFWTQSWGDYKKRFLLAMQAGKGPDIYTTGHEDVPTHAEAGYIIPLDDYIQRYWDVVYYDVFPKLWDACKYKGKTWAVPQDTEARPIYFRKDVLRQLGWSEAEIEALPEKVKNGEFTLDDLLAVAKEAKDKGLVEWGLVHRASKGWDYIQFYLAYGGRLWDPETGKMVFTKSAWLKWAKFFEKAVQEGVVNPNQLGGDWKSLFHEPFTQGRALFASGGTWHKAEWIQKYGLTEESFWENVGFMLHPAGEPGLKPVTLSHPLVYMVTSQCKYPEIAFLLITLVTDPHINAYHAVNSAHLAILKSEVSDSRYVQDKFLADVAYMLDYTTFIPMHPKWADYNDAIFRALSAIETGAMSAEAAYEQLLADVEALGAENVIIEE
ncbi:MAG: ABC transporter substrate-binding protein [Candidatus Altiarchaeales archaeon]|nr:MAG: ABC transporter substrate-binding protein [Candidatus Altiarchaeales archaeon]